MGWDSGYYRLGSELAPPKRPLLTVSTSLKMSPDSEGAPYWVLTEVYPLQLPGRQCGCCRGRSKDPAWDTQNQVTQPWGRRAPFDNTISGVETQESPDFLKSKTAPLYLLSSNTLLQPRLPASPLTRLSTHFLEKKITGTSNLPTTESTRLLEVYLTSALLPSNKDEVNYQPIPSIWGKILLLTLTFSTWSTLS